MSQTHAELDHASTYRTPRWVKVFGIIAPVLILLVVIVLVTDLGGEHGPGRHTQSGDTLPTEEEVQPQDPVGHTPPAQHGGNSHDDDSRPA